MKLLYITRTIDQAGHRDEKSETIEASEITIGRGGSSQIILADSLVSPEHARLSLTSSNEISIQDLGSHSGTLINGRPVSQQTVKAKTRIKLGDIELILDRVGDNWQLIRKIELGKATDPKQLGLPERTFKLSVTANLPNMVLIFTSLSLLAVFLLLIFPLTTKKKEQWSTGQISNPHAMIAKDCHACHNANFVPVMDEQCLVCHKVSEHSPELPRVVRAHPQFQFRCADCHMEHNGDHNFTVTDSRLCTQCHSTIEKFMPDTKVYSVGSLTDHPEFKVKIGKERIPLDNKPPPQDQTKLKLNHKLHLKEGLRGPDGPSTLNCTNCHHSSPDTTLMKPITFEADCQRCHPITFDERLPKSEAPHGDPDAVLNYLYAEYAKLSLLGAPEPVQEESAPTRYRPGGEPAQPIEQKAVAISHPLIMRETRAAEKQLFTRTGCFLCHNVTEKRSTSNAEIKSNYQVVKAEVPKHWFLAANFKHGAHEEVACESCHSMATTSTKTTDILLDGKQLCLNCHGDAGDKNKVRSDCIMCHSYHAALEIEHKEKRSIDVIKSIIKALS